MSRVGSRSGLSSRDWASLSLSQPVFRDKILICSPWDVSGRGPESLRLSTPSRISWQNHNAISTLTGGFESDPKTLILPMTVHLQYDIHNYMFGVITYVSESHWQPRIPYLFSFFFPVEIAIVKLENHDFFPFNFLFLVFFSKRERERVKNVWKTFVELMRLSLKIAEERERDGETRRFDRGEGDKTLEDC